MRIVGGRFKGRALAGPTSHDIRPTSDRLRESLFNILAHAHGDPCEGARVLDLFAGTGALALEAMSRGARFAALVDDGAEARGLIRANIDALGLAGATRVLRRDATRLGPAGLFEPFTLVLCDPPYRHGLAERALASARDGGWLAPGALVVVEEAAEAGFTPPEGFAELERRHYADTEVTFLAAPGAPPRALPETV
jgi:16S rRNA (guanine966-N2)-methyltransferase